MPYNTPNLSRNIEKLTLIGNYYETLEGAMMKAGISELTVKKDARTEHPPIRWP